MDTTIKQKKRNKKRKKNSRPPFIAGGKWLVVGFLLGLSLVAFFFMAFLGDIQEISGQLNSYKPSFTTRLYDNKGVLISELFTENRQYVDLSDIPPQLINAFIVSEDQHFYSHPGIDLLGIARALWQDIIHLKIVEGASTITQQLSRNRFLSHQQLWSRKLKEALLAFLLEKQYTKDEILEAYLNEIYFGHGAYGVKTAAQIYYGKELRELNLAEIAMMVGIPRSPFHFSPYNSFDFAKQQQRRVLRRLHETGLITSQQVEEALDTPIVLSGLQKRSSENPYFVDHILKELLLEFDEEIVFSGGLKVYTSLDSSIQESAYRHFTESGHQGGVLVMDPKNGYILAMVGGRDYQESKFNRTTQARRQPGSSFKPLIYTAAIDNGYTASTVLIDEPMDFPDGWSPQNYEKTFSGAMTLREAVERSTNIIGIKVLQWVGLDKAINYAKRMGIHSNLERNLSLVLGTSEVTLQEMVRAYGVFANGGRVVEPIAILRVEDFDGNTIYENTPSSRQAIPADTAYIMARILQSTIERGTARRANINRPAGGKTGTTEEFIDAWFVGFTPDLVCGIYIGNDDRKPLGAAQTGGIIAAPLFSSIMSDAHQDKPVRDFLKPDSVVEIPICAKTGQLPSSDCPLTLSMPFRPGTTPTSTCWECP